MRIKRTILIILIILIIGVMSFMIYKKVTYKKPEPKPDIPNPPQTTTVTDFNYDIIHKVNKKEENYLVSPYSMIYALSILNEGAAGNTRAQIEQALKNKTISKSSIVQDKISIANALFIKNEYKKFINTNYINTIKDKYDGEILFDDFYTPEVINNWAYKKTYKMIEKVVDQIDKDFVLGIANAIAIDVEWQVKFMENATTKEDFNKLDGTKKEVDMMHSSEGITYISNDNASGIIKDYKKYDDVELEFIAILPNEKDIKKYINNFDEKELNSLLSNQKTTANYDINLSLPKFKYDFDYEDFMKDLISLGITDAFDKDAANFDLMETEDSILDLYVGEAVHKTHIDLSENGTKAAAVTYFGMFKNTAIAQPKEQLIIKFDRPFLYLIKEKNSNNIWFFGTVYEP
ncbi:MAG: hypothetical protein IJK67_05345 [Bacilli bacterium]|nr:hypothetical protein [Bacilli bacterium]